MLAAVVDVEHNRGQGVGDVDRGEFAVAAAQEPVRRAGGVKICAGDLAEVVDAGRLGLRGAWYVDPGEAAAPVEQEAAAVGGRAGVVVGVAVVADDLPGVVDAGGGGSGGAGDVDTPEPALPVAQEAVVAPGGGPVGGADDIAPVIDAPTRRCR
jgi:hypothetical protein